MFLVIRIIHIIILKKKKKMKKLLKENYYLEINNLIKFYFNYEIVLK